MFRVVSLLSKKKLPPPPPPAAVKTLAVVEKKSIASDVGLAVGGGIIKTTGLIAGVGLVGAGAQEFKNSLFDGLGNLANGGLGELGSGLGNIANGIGDNIVNGVILIGGVVICGVIYKVLTKK